jgi:quercetin dioxygenase-like cupin family protein
VGFCSGKKALFESSHTVSSGFHLFNFHKHSSTRNMATKDGGGGDRPLPNPQRHITDHDASGRSFFSPDFAPDLPVTKDLGGAQQRFAYLVPVAPGSLNEQQDLNDYQAAIHDLPPLVPPKGRAAVWYIDMPPGSSSPMHRTVSLDIVVQIHGEVELTLESGETRILKPGDTTIQRSTMHAWRNLSTTDWSRMVGIMAECQPVQAGGRVLGTEFPEPPRRE